jgi:hypothetical protein
MAEQLTMFNDLTTQVLQDSPMPEDFESPEFRIHSELFPPNGDWTADDLNVYKRIDAMLRAGMSPKYVTMLFAVFMPASGLTTEQLNYFGAPIVTHSWMWADSLKSIPWLCDAIYRERLILIFEEKYNLDLKNARYGTEAEALACCLTASAEAPLSHNMTQIHCWAFRRILNRYGIGT